MGDIRNMARRENGAGTYGLPGARNEKIWGRLVAPIELREHNMQRKSESGVARGDKHLEPLMACTWILSPSRPSRYFQIGGLWFHVINRGSANFLCWPPP